MEKYFYLKDLATNKIEVLESQDFDLYFGGEFKDHILYDFYEDKYVKEGLTLPYGNKKIAFFLNFIKNWNNYKGIWSDLQAISYHDLTQEEKFYVDKQIIKKELQYEDNHKNSEIMKKQNLTKKRNKRTKKAGNGDGSFYYSEVLDCLIYQYMQNGKRKTAKQRKNETKTEFKARVAKIKTDKNNGTLIENSKETLKNIISKYIEQKLNDGDIQPRSYKREQDTLKMLEHCCGFINKPVQKVTLQDIQNSKENMKAYAPSVIDKMWMLLSKGFSIAVSPSVKLITFNIMDDENLKKPISNKKTRKVKPLTPSERKKLEHILDNEERNHKYRNIVKMEWLTAMRIGETLARSKNDVKEKKAILHIHNTLTTDENGNIVLSEYTKTYNKETGIDEGKRNFPISAELETIIDEQLSKKITNIYGLLFWNYEKNTFITPQEVNSWLYRLNKKYNISKDGLHNHRLRHDRITQWAEAGVDLRAVQYFAGHVEGSNITDAVYIDVSQEYAFEQFRKLN